MREIGELESLHQKYWLRSHKPLLLAAKQWSRPSSCRIDPATLAEAEKAINADDDSNTASSSDSPNEDEPVCSESNTTEAPPADSQ